MTAGSPELEALSDHRLPTNARLRRCIGRAGPSSSSFGVTAGYSPDAISRLDTEVLMRVSRGAGRLSIGRSDALGSENQALNLVAVMLV